MKKIKILILLMVSIFILAGCKSENLEIDKLPSYKINVGESIEIPNAHKSDDDYIVDVDEGIVTGFSEGKSLLSNSKGNTIGYVIVSNDVRDINARIQMHIAVNEEYTIKYMVSPVGVDRDVYFESSDPSVLIVNQNGVMKGMKKGFATVSVISKINPSIKYQSNVLVGDYDEVSYKKIFEKTIKEAVIDSSDPYKSAVSTLIKTTEQSTVRVQCGTGTLITGVIYKYDVLLKDGTVLKDVSDISKIENIDNIKYYVISNRKDVKKGITYQSTTFPRTFETNIKVILGEKQTYKATLLEYDEKIDLSVLTFNSKNYYKKANINSDVEIKQGEFVFKVGNSDQINPTREVTFGIVSNPKRYLPTDTDGDNISDWDAEYIQFDAAVNASDSGGGVFNLKGELIGITATKIASQKVESMSFAVPIKLTMEIVSLLQQGKTPQRAILGISIIDVSRFYKNKEMFLQEYPWLVVPDNLEYGFIITTVGDGVAKKAGVIANDILIRFNGVETRKSYIIRAELGKFIIGSGEECEIVVLRNGVETTLKVIF